MRSFRIWLICVAGMIIAFYYGLHFGAVYGPSCQQHGQKSLFCQLLDFSPEIKGAL